MEIAVIDWKTIDSRFVKDDLYEHIKAPQWVDFFAPDAPVDDDAWFCRPECNHPKTVEDFYKVATPSSSSSSKLQRSASVSDMPLGERNRRDATLKKRGQIQPSASLIKDMKCDKIVEDGENQNPNFATPPRFKAILMKQTIKSSAEKKPVDEKEEQIPKLRSTRSARNLFAGGDLLNKVSEFCNELKRLVVTRTKEREKCADENLETSPLMGNNKQKETIIVDDKERERKPFMEMNKQTNEPAAKSNTKEKQKRKLRNDNAENTPILVDVKNIKRRDDEILSQIRTNPPTPQCFSASHGITKATPPSKALKSRPLETRGILQELEQISNEGKRKEDPGKMMCNNHQQGQRGAAAIVAEKEAARALDVFWFLKPCALSS